MTRIEIPAELAAEVTAHPEWFRPLVKQGQQVLVLARTSEHPADLGSTTTVQLNSMAGDSSVYCNPPEGGPGGLIASAWASVGCWADTSSPQPEREDRILVLDAGPDRGTIGRMVETSWRDPAVLLLVDDERWVKATEWAILPPAEARPEPGSLVDTDPDLTARMAEAAHRADAARDPGLFVPKARRNAMLAGSRPEAPGGPAGFDETPIDQALDADRQRQALLDGLIGLRVTADRLISRFSTANLSGDDAANQALARANGDLARRLSVRVEENRLLKQRLAAADADVTRLTNALTTMTADRDQLKTQVAEDANWNDAVDWAINNVIACDQEDLVRFNLLSQGQATREQIESLPTAELFAIQVAKEGTENG